MARGKLTAQGVGMAFAMNGVEGIVQLEARLHETASENVLKKAIQTLEESGGNTHDLETFLGERYPQSEGRQGRRAVQIGETRTYKTSENGTISVSAKAWGLNPGQEVTIQYTENGFEIVG